jgi:hypothetical protein
VLILQRHEAVFGQSLGTGASASLQNAIRANNYCASGLRSRANSRVEVRQAPDLSAISKM